jgi:hypothetical protein
MFPVADGILRRLDAARQKWWFFTMLTTAALAVCVSLATMLLFMGLDALLKLPQMMLAALFLIWLALTVALIWGASRRLVRGQRGLEATARRVEAEFPELDSELINLVQLSEDTKNENRAFCEAAVRQAANRIGVMQFDTAADRETRWRRFCYCMQTPRDFTESLALLGVLLAITVGCHLLIPNWGSAASRLLSPWEFVPSIGKTGEIVVTPENREVLVGASVEITGTIKNETAQPQKATLFVTNDKGEQTEAPMQGDKDQARFAFTVPSVTEPFSYRLEIGDSQSKVFRITVQEKPTITGVEVTYRFPAYMGRKDETITLKTPDLDAPQFTVADFRIHASVPLSQGHIKLDGVRSGRVSDEDAKILTIERVPLLDDGTFTIHLTTASGQSDTSPRANRIRVVKDRAPTIELLKPGRQSNSAPGGEVQVAIRAGDDYGLGRIRLEMKVEEARPEGEDGDEADAPATDVSEPIRLEQWTNFERSTTAVRNYTLALSPERFKPGQTIKLRAVAWDTRLISNWGRELTPWETASGWHTIRLESPEAKSQAQLEKLDTLRTTIWRLLERQIKARGRAAVIAHRETDLAGRQGLTAEVRVDQVEIQKTTQETVKTINETDKEDRLAIKRALNKLAFDEMLKAVEAGDRLGRATTVEAFDSPVGELVALQDRIIEGLRKLVDVTRQAEAEALSEMKKRQQGDMPDDTQKKFEDARNKLEEFLKQQKKVIEASESLAKKPVEDFTDKDEEALKGLAAKQDDFNKMMKELHSDLSKLPEQDFANASMLKELVEIQTELKMAEDALLKKSADIAVPLEQLGYERADEIKTNLEKWLPDTPDREKWSQEESLTDQDKEAPMAELPGELEDLIGELMEEEEDLFDEMEDVSSSAMDSLDKGAGWDVADGPISNNSAKGATGNRLPNTSEIGGRSGEGRTGKSSGEFVGDEAVGKGGRKTPARLTPDPYVKGQIKDHEKDGQGGATGGGKESGQGSEGLEGPAPGNRGPRDLQRLAEKQAALRNKAEGVDVQFGVMNYHRTDLKNLIETMKQVEVDLHAGRYQSALRERKVLLDNMGNVKQYLEGEFVVKQDATSNLPTDIQKEILGSMQDASPSGWEELNRQYFERLSTSGN